MTDTTAQKLVKASAATYWTSSAGKWFDRRDCHALLNREDGVGVVLAFRGSANLRDWFSNIDRKRTAAPDDIPGKVHHGFATSFESVWAELKTYLANNVTIDEPILLAGHSRGAAHATLAAARLIMLGYNVTTLHTFGSPRVGSPAFARFVDNWIADVRRYSNESDPVPRLPRIGYHHAGRLYWRDGGQWRHRAGFFRRLSTFILARRWPYVGDAFSDHKMENYVDAIDS